MQDSSRLDAEVAQNMRDFFATLSEKDRRRFAAIEARRLGYGGIQDIAAVLGCSRRTIARGIEELDQLARWGFNALWLIGVWERSPASSEIKQRMGNPEAAASAYSLYDYTIAEDLGGEAAYANLRDRAWPAGSALPRTWSRTTWGSTRAG
jgi:hypothetical protein